MTIANQPAAVLGMGVVSALGPDLAQTRCALYADNPALPALPALVSTTLRLPVFELTWLHTDPQQPGGRSLQLLLLALRQALDHAQLTPQDLQNARVGVAIGTTVACQLNSIPFYQSLRTNDNPAPAPLQHYVNGIPAEYLRRTLGLHGPALTVSNACASGADAIGIARLWLNQNLCDIVIAGGTDEINKVPLDGFNALGVCSPDPCRPFDANRQGLNLGEAAGLLILARPDSSYTPHTPFLVSGFGKTADAFHITQPDPAGTGLRNAILNALTDAALAPADIAFANAHGTGTQANDLAEATVFSQLFPHDFPFMSTKALTGHTLGAAGAIEAVFTCLMLEQQRAARSLRCDTPDPALPAAPLRDHLPLHDARNALSTSLAFGGSNSALVLSLT